MTTHQGLEALSYRTKLITMGGLTLALFMAAANQTSVATAAQSIVADIGGFEVYTWLFAGFSLAAAVAIPILGKISDTFGRKHVLLGALLLFLCASILCSVAESIMPLIAFRVAQGLGSAGVMGSVMILVADLWPAADRAKWLGAVSVGFSLAGLSGPVIGGAVSEYLSWRWLFLVNVPVGVVAVLIFYLWLPRDSSARPQSPRRFDVLGALYFSVGVTTLLLLLTLTEAFDSASATSGGLLLLSVIALVLFFRTESRVSDPIIPIHLFRNRIFGLSWVVSLTLNSSLLTIVLFVPLFVEGVLAKSATSAAPPLMAMALGITVGSVISGQLLSRYGHPRWLGVFALAVCTSGLYGMSATCAQVASHAHGPWLPVVTTMTLLAGVVGAGVAFAVTVFTVPAQNALPRRHLGVVTSMLQFARMLGVAVGSAAFGALLHASLAAGASDAMTDAAAALRDPAVLIDDVELGSVRDRYLADPSLGEASYQEDLAVSRGNLAGAIQTIFTTDAAINAMCIIVGFFAFRTRHSE